MKKFIVRILIFFAVVALIDVAFGYACRYLNSHAKGGDTQNHYYVAKECDKDILIFGSSRAMRHYVPKIIEDSLGVSCYNCGVNGNGIVYLYSRLKLLTNRYTPKLILYDINDIYDIAPGDNSKYLGWQKRFYNEIGMKEAFEIVNPLEKYKMQSKLYQYNSDFMQMLTDNIHPMQENEYGGYRPLKGIMLYEPNTEPKSEIEEWDTIKKELMLKFINLCREKNIKLIFMRSPSYGVENPLCKELFEEFVVSTKCDYFNYYNDTSICLNKNYFYDSVHLNNNGAEVYTKMIINIISQSL